MTNKELKEILSKVPDNSIIYVQSDHGQQCEQSGQVLFTTQDLTDKPPYYGEDINWLIEEQIAENDDYDLITAILIF